MGRARLVIASAALAAVLVSAQGADAHAFLQRSSPAAGSVVRTPPREVRLVFSEPVRPGPGIKVVNSGHSVVAGKPQVPAGHPNEIVIPLRTGLGSGPYAVLWSDIDEEDGHEISGAFIFSVGAGLAPPVSIGSVQGSSGAPLSHEISRWLLLAGILVAAGSFGFTLLVRRVRRPDRTDTIVLAAALAVATLGAGLTVLVQDSSLDTSFGKRTLVGACVAAVATVAALVPRLWLVAGALAVALLGLPAATGHASASGVTHAVSIPFDVAHLAAAAFWIGGVLQLVVRRRSELARRFTPFALAAVALLGATGIVRAFNEFSAVSQVWNTSYGRAVLIKTGLLAVILLLAWSNRRRLATVRIGVELALLAVVVGAVAVLTNVRPGRDYAAAATPAKSTSTVVYAGQDDKLAVGLAVTPQGEHAVELRATVLGFNGPAGGLHLRLGVDGHEAGADACGRGCYRATVPIGDRPRAITVQIGDATLRFDGPTQWPAPDGLPMVRRAEETINNLRTLVVHSHLASDSKHAVTTIYKMVAPNRLAFHNIGLGDSIIIGNRRWDRPTAKAPFVESPQVPALRQPAPFWTPNVTNAHVLRTARVDGHDVWVVSFVDPSTPAWFTAWIDRANYRTLRLDMVAAAHFMHDRDGPFNEPLSVEPPG